MILKRKLRLKMISFGPTMHFQKHFLELDFVAPGIKKKDNVKKYFLLIQNAYPHDCLVTKSQFTARN